MLMRHLRFPAVLLPSLLLVLASCSAASSPSAAAGGTTIDVTVQEWAVVPAAASAAAGEVTFHITNDGPADVHEFVVLKSDLAPDALPTASNGSADEAGGEVIDEIEEIPVGETMDLTVTLAAGKYVLLCNIFDETENESHYQMGMRTAFTVE
jgi:uncharacterized cupredoxin-like copper-binding protein